MINITLHARSWWWPWEANVAVVSPDTVCAQPSTHKNMSPWSCGSRSGAIFAQSFKQDWRLPWVIPGVITPSVFPVGLRDYFMPNWEGLCPLVCPVAMAKVFRIICTRRPCMVVTWGSCHIHISFKSFPRIGQLIPRLNPILIRATIQNYPRRKLVTFKDLLDTGKAALTID